MRYLDEQREGREAWRIANEIRALVTRPHRIMEVCGGQAHAIVRFTVDRLLPPDVELLHGPGCSSVTSTRTIDMAIEAASRPDVTICTLGEMLRVPGTSGDLESARAAGRDVRVVYSPLDAVTLAEQYPDREVVFFTVGLETTAPTCAMAAVDARSKHLTNFSLLVCHELLPLALESLLAREPRVDGLLAAGHPAASARASDYGRIARARGIPIVVTGFEPLDVLHGLQLCLRQLEERRADVEIQYHHSLRPEANVRARDVLNEVYEPVGPSSCGVSPTGLALREPWVELDAERKLFLGATRGGGCARATCARCDGTDGRALVRGSRT